MLCMISFADIIDFDS